MVQVLVDGTVAAEVLLEDVGGRARLVVRPVLRRGPDGLLLADIQGAVPVMLAPGRIEEA
jgi:hypothetical protein